MEPLSKMEQAKLLEEFGSDASRVIIKTSPIIRKTYQNDIVLIDLLMALPVKFEFAEYDHSAIQPMDGQSIPTLAAMAIGGYITRDTEAGNPDRLVVFITFNKDINQTWADYFQWILHTPELISHAAFTYLHEALHLLNRHYDYYLNAKYYTIAQHANPDLNEGQIHKILNHAFDYWINAFLIEKANHGSHINRFKDGEDFANLYDANLTPDLMSQQEIVRKLALEAEINTQEIPGVGELVSITINGNTSSTLHVKNQHQVEQGREETQGEQEIGEVLDTARGQLLDKSRGSGSQGGFTDLGVSYEVPIDWFNSLKSSLFTMVQRYTNNSDQTWSKLKNKFRHVSPMPGRVYYDNQIAAVISIDQSGSMSDDDLRKINYVVTELARKSVFIEVLLHDTSIGGREKFVGANPNIIESFITKRVSFGGTSHAEVFSTVKEIREANPKIKLIYLSFSDNWSDIDQVYNPDDFKDIVSYWITTDENRTVNVPGMQISLEHGLLRE